MTYSKSSLFMRLSAAILGFMVQDLGKGTGVGLFMSKTIIEKNMGGPLSVCNIGDGVELRIEV